MLLFLVGSVWLLTEVLFIAVSPDKEIVDFYLTVSDFNLCML